MTNDMIFDELRVAIPPTSNSKTSGDPAGPPTRQLFIITSKHKIKIFLRASSNFIDLKFSGEVICFFSFALYYFFVDCTQLRTSKLLESYSSAGDDCIFGYSSGIQIPFCRLVPQRSVQK